MQSQRAFDFVVVSVAISLSFAAWCLILFIFGLPNNETALLSLLELPLLALFYSMLAGSRLASIVIGIVLAATAVVWISYLYQALFEQAYGSSHFGHVVCMALIAMIVVMKVVAACICLFSSSFANELRDHRQTV